MVAYDVAHFLAGMMLVASFMLLYQDRIFAVLNTFAAQAMLLALAVAWQGYIRHHPDLFITAAMAFGLKGIVIPLALNRMVVRLGIHREVDKAVNVGAAMFLGLGLTSLALLLVLKVTPGAASFTREGLALALAIILLGFLMMITRRNAVTPDRGLHVHRERAHPRRDRRAGHAARRGGERRLFGADRAVRVRGFRIPHPRAFR